jgi:hypothetical protein
MIDFGGARHWASELGKLAEQEHRVGNQHFRRTKFGGPYMWFDPVAEKEEEERQQRAYQERMAKLRVTTEWYSMSEEERLNIGKELFPMDTLSSAVPTREEFQKLKGTSQKIDIGQGHLHEFDRRMDTDVYVPESFTKYLIKRGNENSYTPFTEIEKLTGAERFREFAFNDNYFERNEQLDYFAGERIREQEEAQRRRRPEVIQEAKNKALAQREELASIGSVRKTRELTKKTPLQISTPYLETETVNIPT